MNRAYLLLGSNLDDRLALLASAWDKINRVSGRVIASSSIYESEPWGFQAEQNFLNQVLLIETELLPCPLLQSVLSIEKSMGRTRCKGDGFQSRQIDIDILFYNDEVISQDNLDIPHPRIPERMFALLPLVELNRGLLHPGILKTAGQMLAECTDPGRVAIFKQQ
jgi:2-amino-4-hydroxy-6-hydroxymethyldihydropteridine diphosphokinase